MGSISQLLKNGANLPLNAGSAAIGTGDLLEIGGPGNEAWTVATADYAANAASGTLFGPTALVAAKLAGASRAQVARDRLGNIFHAGTNSSGNLVIYKVSPLGVSLGSVTADSTATIVATPKFFQIQNGNFACVYAMASGALYFVIVDAALNLIAGPTSVATEYASGNVVYHDAIPLNGGGLGISFQTSAGTAINLATYSNAGAVVQAAMNIQTLASTAAQEFLRLGQLSSGNLVCSFRGAMTAGGIAGTGFVIVTVAGGAVAGPTNIDNTAVLGFLEFSALSGFFSLAEANGTTLKASVFNNAGALQGSQYSIADTLNSITYPQVKLTNDGVQFWLSYFGSAASGLNVVQMPTAGATGGTAATGLGSSILSASTYALDAEIINGILVALAASSATSGQYWLSVGLPDASLGIGAPYLRTVPTTFGAAAATTGSYWPRVMSGGGGLYTGTTPPAGQPTNPPTNGDFTAIFVYDQQNTAATIIGAQKIEASAIIGLSSAAAISANVPGTAIPSVNPGPGDYTVNPIAGTNGTSFNHVSATPAGNQGVLYNAGVAFGSSISGGVTSGNAASSSSLTAGGVWVPGFMGYFGTGFWRTFFSSGTFTVPAGITKLRVRVVGAGGGGGSGSNSTYGGTGGTSSFGALISATGGTGGVGGSGPGGVGGTGYGGQVQFSGGNGGSGSYGGNGGAASGSQLGNGGSCIPTQTSTGGASVGGVNSTSATGGASMFGGAVGAIGGLDILGNAAVAGANGTNNPLSVPLRFPFDGFTGGGGGGVSGSNVGNGGTGAGGGYGGGNGGVGGGGGGGYSGTGTNKGGNGGYGGGGGYGSDGSYNAGGSGAGGGYAHGTFSVTPGTVFTVTVGTGGAPGSSYGGTGGNSIVVVEW